MFEFEEYETPAPVISGSMFADFLVGLAPKDFAERRPYVLLASEGVPDEFLPNDSQTMGFTGPRLDLALHDWLSDCGLWRGRGPAIILIDDIIADEADASGEGFLTTAIAVLLHEAAHVLAMPVDTSAPVEPTANEIDDARDLLTKLAAIPAGEMPLSRPWAGHDGRFIQILAHLAHRAERRLSTQFSDTSDPYLFDAAAYGLSSPFREYRRALHPQPSALVAASFDYIREAEPPAEFVNVWKADVKAWFVNDPSADAETALEAMSMFDGCIAANAPSPRTAASRKPAALQPVGLAGGTIMAPSSEPVKFTPTPTPTPTPKFGTIYGIPKD